MRKFLINCIHPLENTVKVLYNIYTGEACSEKTIVNQPTKISKKLMIEFQRSLPEGIREYLLMKVVTMAEGTKVKNKDEIVEL